MPEMIESPATSPELRSQLETIEQARIFAQGLGLDVDEQYTEYVAWPGDRIITNLVVAEPLSVDSRPFRYPILGELPYRGFFDEGRAETAAQVFVDQGYDVCLVPVSAYSTLGFFSDPVTAPMLRRGKGPAVETILHEFVHATVFVDGDAGFNESAASFIGQQGSIDFFSSDPDQAKVREQQIHDNRLVSEEALRFREEVRTIYENASEATDQRVREKRVRAEQEARARLSRLPLELADPELTSKYVGLNDACLALRGTYGSDLTQHQVVFERLDRNLPKFISRLKEAAGRPDPRAWFFSISLSEGSSRQAFTR